MNNKKENIFKVFQKICFSLMLIGCSQGTKPNESHNVNNWNLDEGIDDSDIDMTQIDCLENRPVSICFTDNCTCEAGEIRVDNLNCPLMPPNQGAPCSSSKTETCFYAEREECDGGIEIAGPDDPRAVVEANCLQDEWFISNYADCTCPMVCAPDDMEN